MSPLATWARRRPHAADAIRLTLSLVLLALVPFEGVVLARQPSLPHAAVWISGILVRLSAAPWSTVPLLTRAGFSAAVTWTVTLLLIFGNHPLIVWGGGEAIALLVLLSQVLLRAPPVPPLSSARSSASAARPSPSPSATPTPAGSRSPSRS
ncbi:hypothetical protein [Streptomyces sp. NBC_00211]|uniref:hypothetical protein n=1 Tax=Streptomyces sp. NBC_00211 TaxID=2975683 RepID=UPI0032477488